MKTTRKVVLVIIVDLILVFSALSSRSLQRLLIWNIEEVKDKEFFYSKEIESRLKFEKDTPEIVQLKNKINSSLAAADTDIDEIVKIMNFVRSEYILNYSPGNARLKPGSPSFLMEQIKDGAKGANCFQFAIIFSACASSLGFKSRLWNLEADDGLGRIGHVVAEVYLPGHGKWVMFDPTFSVYFQSAGQPLSVMEARDCFLQNQCKVSVKGSLNRGPYLPLKLEHYRRFLVTVLLRSYSDFSFKYGNPRLRWGMLVCLEDSLKQLPYHAQLALEFLFGRREYFFQFVDKGCPNLSLMSWISKLCAFGFFLINFILLVLYLRNKIHAKGK